MDLYGFIDIVALDLGRGRFIGVQSCGEQFSGHRKKILEECSEAAKDWLHCGGEVWLLGWKKYKKPVDGKWWRPRREELALVGGHLVFLETTA
jgi:hypothetical protein